MKMEIEEAIQIVRDIVSQDPATKLRDLYSARYFPAPSSPNGRSQWVFELRIEWGEEGMHPETALIIVDEHTKEVTIPAVE